MPSIVDDYTSIRARADQLNGKAYEPGYKAPEPHQSPDPVQHWATGGTVTGASFHQQSVQVNLNANKRPPNEVIEDFAKTMYGLIGQYTAYPSRSRPPFAQVDTKVKMCYLHVAKDLFYAGMLAEKP